MVMYYPTKDGLPSAFKNIGSNLVQIPVSSSKEELVRFLEESGLPYEQILETEDFKFLQDGTVALIDPTWSKS